MSQLLLFESPNPALTPPQPFKTSAENHSTPAPAARSIAAPVAGVCMYCGCHSDFCVDRTGERCEWLDASHSICTAEPCRAKLSLEKPAHVQRPKSVRGDKPARPRRSHTYAAAINRWLSN